MLLIKQNQGVTSLLFTEELTASQWSDTLIICRWRAQLANLPYVLISRTLLIFLIRERARPEKRKKEVQPRQQESLGRRKVQGRTVGGGIGNFITKKPGRPTPNTVVMVTFNMSSAKSSDGQGNW